MYSAASGWLMRSLNPEPFIVSMVQVATTLPVFLFALPAGAIADIVDRRKFLIVAEIVVTLLSALYAAVVAWPGDTIQPALVHVPDRRCRRFDGTGLPGHRSPARAKQDLHAAIAANSAGVNVSRAVGPALGGLIVARFGIAAPFWINAFSNLASIGAFVWWRPARAP